MAGQPDTVAADEGSARGIRLPARLRRGSSAGERPLAGRWLVIADKELGDHILGVRFFILLAILGLAAAGAIYSTASYVRGNAQNVAGLPGLFVLLFSHSDPNSQVPSFAVIIGLLGPLLGIVFGFDAVNGERAERTLPRLVAQPIHRDDVINGKFVAGLSAIALVLGAVVLIVAGVAFFELGVVPSADDVARMLAWFVVTLAYIGLWLAFAMLCSVLARRAATSAVAAFSVWIALTLFGSLVVGILSDALAPVPATATLDQQVANAQLRLDLSRIAPDQLFTEATAYLLDPTTQTVGIVLSSQTEGALPNQVLPFEQSLLLGWAQAVTLIALTVVCFGITYVVFIRQEVRA